MKPDFVSTARFALTLAFICVIAALPAPASAEPLSAFDGISDHRVYQRNADDSADFSFSFKAGDDVDKVQYRITNRGLALEGRDWQEAHGEGEITVKVGDLTVGGPYDVELIAVASDGEIIDARGFRNILVGDIWVLAGQSNMEGVGNLDKAPAPSAWVNSFGMSDVWEMAVDPLHLRSESTYPVYRNVGNPGKSPRVTGEQAREQRDGRTKGAGLGLPFAKRMYEATGVPIGLLPCAYGGTSMAQWSPDKKDLGDMSLYGSMIQRIEKVGGNVTGVLWYQGESDANHNAADVYHEKFKSFIETLRKDVGDPDLPFYYVQIGRFVRQGRDGGDWDRVQDIQRQLQRELPRVGTVATVDLALDDLIHVGTPDLAVVGHRLAILAGIELFPDHLAFRGLKTGPRIESVKVEGRQIRVTYSRVNGGLISAGRLNGFTLSAEGEENPPQPFNMYVDPENTNSVVLLFQDAIPENAKLWYGRGLDPYCNLRDQAGMAALAAGPLEISR